MTYINLSFELGDLLDAARESDDLSAADLVTLHATEQESSVVASLSTVKLLVEGLWINVEHRNVVRYGPTYRYR